MSFYQMDNEEEIEAGVWAHQKEPQKSWLLDDKRLLPLGIDFMTPAFHRRSKRLKLRSEMESIRARQSGLIHPIHGHMNKHLLTMKYFGLGRKKR